MQKQTATTPNPLPIAENNHAERAILTALMIEPSIYDQVSNFVQGSDFLLPSHRAMWQAMGAMRADRRDFNPIALWDQLTRTGDADKFSGIGDLGRFIDGMPFYSRFESVRGFAEIVLRASLAREMSKLATYAQAKINDREVDEFALIEDLQARLKKLQGRRMANDWTTGSASLNQAVEELEQAANGIRPDVVPTGFSALDALLINRGMVPGNYFLIAARTSRGKSTLALQMAHHALTDGQGRCVAYFTVEMSAVELMKRLIAIQVQIPYEDFRQGRFSKEQAGEIMQLQESARTWQFPIIYRGKLTPSMIHAEASRIKQEYGRLDMVVIDHIGLLRPDRKTDSRVREIGQISGDIKSLLVDLDCVGIVPCQVNREGGKAADRIQLTHLRDSGDLEQDADMVGIINITDEGDRYNRVAFDLAKQRNGRTGVVEMEFDLSCGRFISGDYTPKTVSQVNWKKSGGGVPYWKEQ